MSTLYDKYRSKVSTSKEDMKVELACAKPCGIQIKTKGGVCRNTTDLAPYFEGKKKWSGVVPPAWDNPDEFRCWNVLPPLSLSHRPPTLKSPEEIQKIRKSECYKCRRTERLNLQSQMVYSPDARFWIGVGAASASVLVGLMVAITRR
jgi:hypothetical protein